MKNKYWLVLFLFASVMLGFLFVKPVIGKNEVNKNYRQVKIAGDPTVYYLDYKLNKKKAYVNERAFFVYGNKWSDISTVSEEYLNNWEDVELVKTRGSNTVYFIKNFQRAIIKSENDFYKFGFNWQDVVTINTIDLNQYLLTDYDGVGIVESDSDNILKVSFDNDFQTNEIALNTDNNLLAVLKFSSLKGNNQLTRLDFRLKGVFDEDIIKDIEIRDENDEEYQIWSKIYDRTLEINFRNNSISILESKDKVLKIYANLGSQNDCTNNTMQLELENYANVFTNTDSQLVGAFPIDSKVLSLVCVNGISSMLESRETYTQYNSNDLEVKKSELVGKYDLIEKTNNENVIISKIILENKGTADNDNLENFVLKNRRNKIIAKAKKFNNNDEIIFNVKDYILNRGEKDTLKLYVDIINGNNEVINFDLISILAKGEDYNFGVKTNYLNIDELLTIKKDKLQVAVRENRGNNRVFKQAEGIIIGNFQIRNGKDDVVINNIEFELNNGSVYDDVSIVDYYSGDVLDVIDAPGNGNNSIVAEINYDLKKRKTLQLAVLTKLKQDFSSSVVLRTDLKMIEYTDSLGKEQIDYYNLNGATLSFGKSSLFVTKNVELDTTIEKGDRKAKLASFNIEVLGEDDVIIDSLNITPDNALDLVTYNNGFRDLTVYINNRRISDVYGAPYGDIIELNHINYRIQAGRSVELKVVADISASANVSEVRYLVEGVVALGAKSNLDTDVNGDNVESLKVKIIDAETSVNYNYVYNNSYSDSEKILNWPVSGVVGFGFHDSRYISIYGYEHQGIDITVNQGTSIKAAMNGKVVEAYDAGYGYNFIVIQHSNSLKTVYGHILEFKVSLGDEVVCGQEIGLSGGQIGTPGAGSNTKGPHLHFEVIKNNSYVDPLKYLK